MSAARRAPFPSRSAARSGRAITAAASRCARTGASSTLHAHHVEHWAHGGPTSLDNLVLLCSFHHRLLHEGGFRMSLAANGAPRFFTSRGREIAFVPDVPRAPAAPPPAVVDPDINLSSWDGEPVDYHEAVDAMCVASG